MLGPDQVDRWLAVQTWPDIRPAEDDPSFLHPYGFVVIRLGSPRIEGWNARLHLWHRAHRHPPWSVPGVADQAVHSHGWEVRTRTLVGAVRHTDYSVVADPGSPGRLYEVDNDRVAGVSRLTRIRDGVGLEKAGSSLAVAGSPITVVPRGAFHTTVAETPGTWAATVVATEDADGSTCGQVWSGRDTGAGSSNVRRAVPDLRTCLAEVDAEHRAERSDELDWVSFAMITVGSDVLLARTYRFPELWQPVGGHRLGREATPIDTVVREVSEEVGLGVDRNRLELLCDVPRDRGSGRMHVWRLRLPDRPDLHPLDEEIIEIGWFPLAAVDRLAMLPATRAVVARMRERP